MPKIRSLSLYPLGLDLLFYFWVPTLIFLKQIPFILYFGLMAAENESESCHIYSFNNYIVADLKKSLHMLFFLLLLPNSTE